jgi:hypothetical protein
MVVFGFPDDSTIGTVDLPQVWNQKPRESMYLHWDGNNNKIHERNYAAAMAVGATPESVLPPSFNRVTNWLLGHKAPAWPFALDQAKVVQGKPLWDANLRPRAGAWRADTGQVTTNIDQLGTDPHRLDSFTTGLVTAFHTSRNRRSTSRVSQDPELQQHADRRHLAARAVPAQRFGATLWDLLQPPEKRPVVFITGSDVYDPVSVGFVTRCPGQSLGRFHIRHTRLEGSHKQRSPVWHHAVGRRQACVDRIHENPVNPDEDYAMSAVGHLKHEYDKVKVRIHGFSRAWKWPG